MGMKVAKALAITGISKHQYYYHKRLGKSGRKPSIYTSLIDVNGNETRVGNESVIDKIIVINGVDDDVINYGYRAMCKALQLRGFMINHKKVYRLMKEYHLLGEKRKKTSRTFVKHRLVIPEFPLQCLEMDIKFQYVEEYERHAFILTVIDCMTRHVLGWTVAYSIKQAQVKLLWEELIVNYLQPNDMLEKEIRVELRNDNDSRFVAESVQKFFKENHITQVFTHPYTPQENGHIESFHSILGTALDKQRYGTINDLEEYLGRFYEVYNKKRLHGSLDHLSPSVFWKAWNADLIEVIPRKGGKIRYKLKVPHYKLSGYVNLRELLAMPERHTKKCMTS